LHDLSLETHTSTNLNYSPKKDNPNLFILIQQFSFFKKASKYIFNWDSNFITLNSKLAKMERCLIKLDICSKESYRSTKAEKT